MFLTSHLKQKFFHQGKVEGKVERDAEWIEWAKNGEDPDKMPSKINPVTTSADNKAESKKS